MLSPRRLDLPNRTCNLLHAVPAVKQQRLEEPDRIFADLLTDRQIEVGVVDRAARLAPCALAR